MIEAGGLLNKIVLALLVLGCIFLTVPTLLFTAVFVRDTVFGDIPINELWRIPGLILLVMWIGTGVILWATRWYSNK